MKRSLSRIILISLVPLYLMGLIALYWQQKQSGVTKIIVTMSVTEAVVMLGITSALLIIVFKYIFHRLRTTNEDVIEAMAMVNQEEHRRFVQRLDHELKNPLTALKLSTENLRSENTNNVLDIDIQNIGTQSERLVQLTNDLRKLATFESHELEFEIVNVGQILEDLIATADDTGLLSTSDSARVVNLSIPKAPWPVEVYVDSDLLQLGLYNLLDNAVKYSTKGDTIELSAMEDGKRVHIMVADTGIGIKERDFGYVCDELFRGENARDRPGNGIGLALVKGIVDRFGGEMSIESKESIGTKVSIQLPLS